MQDGKEEQSHPAAGVVVKHLENVQSTLRGVGGVGGGSSLETSLLCNREMYILG